MNRQHSAATRTTWAAVALLFMAGAGSALQDSPYSGQFDREGCTFVTSGNNPWHPLWPGYSLRLEGEEDDDGELVTIRVQVTVLEDTEVVDGVLTRVLEEREWENGELVEVSRNFVVTCRETGDLWYFGEDVDDYEDGEIVAHEGAWRAGEDGAEPGILMLGNPVNGARYFQEQAPEADALDRAQVQSRGNLLEVPAGTFANVLHVVDSTPLDPESADDKYYAHGWGLIKDEAAELVAVEVPPCIPSEEVLCLRDGRFGVFATWRDFDGNLGSAFANQVSGDSGEMWFFDPNNSELLVKVLNGCEVPGLESFWVFAAGLTNVEVSLTVVDTQADEIRTYRNEIGTPFLPVQDTSAFATCP